MSPIDTPSAPVAASDKAVYLQRIATPLGPLLAGATERVLYLLAFADGQQHETQLARLQARLGCRFLTGWPATIASTERQLGEYFSGQRQRFDLPLQLAGTPFQQAVWHALGQVPYGETVSYGKLARRIGRPKATRAVARANRDNCLPILIPCHRAIGADGRLTGYSGGVWRKQWLLALEGAAVGQSFGPDGLDID